MIHGHENYFSGIIYLNDHTKLYKIKLKFKPIIKGSIMYFFLALFGTGLNQTNRSKIFT